jgi:hypothetical protein
MPALTTTEKDLSIMADTNHIIDLSRADVLSLALIASAAATEAYCDERLNTAASQHHLAARLWASVGYDGKARHHSVLAQTITTEMLELAAGEAE